MVELSRECGFREKGSGENCGKSTSVLSRNGRGWVVAVPLKETDHPPVIKGRSISPCHRASLVYSRVLVRGHLWVVGSFQTIYLSKGDVRTIRRESTILRDSSESDGEIPLGCRTSGRPTPAWVGLFWHPGVEE
ncbi:hypothetical protein BHM03_00033377 [Ensete ventricosum]|nr:hypothetical protein BHM03_00033377 [Ensete ventricosum]